MRIVALATLGLTLASGAAEAAKVTKQAYPTAIMAAKAEAARRFDADRNIGGVFGKTGRKTLSATRLGNKLSFKVSYAAAWAGTAVTKVRTVKKADGFHAYTAKKVTLTDL
jgi:hypothetical protein